MSFNPAGGALSGATDVAMNNPINGHVLTYDGSIAKWENALPPAGGSGATPGIIIAANNAPQSWKDAATYQCDGTDDGVEINSAIASVTESIGEHIVLSPGTFNVTQTNRPVISKGNIWLQGSGMGATIIRATGAWTTTTLNSYTDGTPILDVFNENTSGLFGAVKVSDLFIYGVDIAGTSGMRVHINRNTIGNNGRAFVGPDAVCRFLDIAIEGVQYTGLWVTGDNTGKGTNSDAQACMFQGFRIFHAGRHGVIAGGADNLFALMDVGSCGSNSDGTAHYGYFLDGGNHHFVTCKAWYMRKGSAALPSGSGWHINVSRAIITGCESQDNAGHGFYFRNARGSFENLMAHSNSSTLTDGTSSAAHGIYIEGNNAAFLRVTGYAFNQGPSAISQGYGVFCAGAALTNSDISVTTYSNNLGPFGGTAVAASSRSFVAGT